MNPFQDGVFQFTGNVAKLPSQPLLNTIDTTSEISSCYLGHYQFSFNIPLTAELETSYHLLGMKDSEHYKQTKKNHCTGMISECFADMSSMKIGKQT